MLFSIWVKSWIVLLKVSILLFLLFISESTEWNEKMRHGGNKNVCDPRNKWCVAWYETSFHDNASELVISGAHKMMLLHRNCKVKIQNEVLLFRTSHGKKSFEWLLKDGKTSFRTVTCFLCNLYSKSRESNSWKWLFLACSFKFIVIKNVTSYAFYVIEG